MPDLSPVDEARIAVATAALALSFDRHESAEDLQAAEGALDLAAVRLVAELEAERAS
jgi:hypothetical protein